MHGQSYGEIYRLIIRTRKVSHGVSLHAMHISVCLLTEAFCDCHGVVCKLEVMVGRTASRRVGPGQTQMKWGEY